jgi:hypothetical protein
VKKWVAAKCVNVTEAWTEKGFDYINTWVAECEDWTEALSVKENMINLGVMNYPKIYEYEPKYDKTHLVSTITKDTFPKLYKKGAVK